ncbi:assimilatory nitrite reductase large subunit [Endozoicomonas sp. OPT23]|uniref:NAD(P)/FAD-dependent oxidoreductase n=1 Tax=Endozoicomonas sp. OPT23 TaxID=2072845 RepID=UPI00129AD20E|nr:FAD-dependent oxidoreductase [Endozoicomonas sp. OPT23]MRI34652.1 assimilatory nitrite reductase large subunit [Endozoicomonas sp. OPT23]
MSAAVKRLLVVGNGMGAVRFLEKLVEFGAESFQVTVLSEEDLPGYNRIQLSSLLAGNCSLSDIQLQSLSWYQSNNITLLMGAEYKAVSIDRNNKQVTTKVGDCFDYDELVLATGSVPNRIPVSGADLDNVIAFRTLDDVKVMQSIASGQGAVVIGGGLLGLECAAGLAAQGLHVTVIDTMPYPMPRQLDARAGELLKQAMEQKGVAFRCGAQLESYLGHNGTVSHVQLKSGERLSTELVVVTAGVRPDISLAVEAGLDSGRGICVNDRMQTSDPSITALGECVQLGEQLFGLVAPVYSQAEIAAKRLTARSGERFVSEPVPARLKVAGVEVFSCGRHSTDEEAGDEEIILDAGRLGVYRKLIVNNGCLQGVLLFGDTASGSWYQTLLEEQQNITAIRQQLIFGQEYMDSMTASIVDRAA